MIESTLSITAYMHCKQCVNELPEGTSPQEYSSLEVGWTKRGLQVWCFRHKVNVCHIDFEDARHPANDQAKKAITSPPQLELVCSFGASPAN